MIRSFVSLLLATLVAGCASAPQPAASANPGQRWESTDGALHPDLQRLYGPDNPLKCQKARFCGVLVKIDCGSQVDVPILYFDNRDGRKVAQCGGMQVVRPGVAAERCPPKEWTCLEDPTARLRAQADAWDAAIVRKDRAAIAAKTSEGFRQTTELAK